LGGFDFFELWPLGIIGDFAPDAFYLQYTHHLMSCQEKSLPPLGGTLQAKE
jgi:hypothetical protein